MPFLSLERAPEKIGGVCLISGTIFILVRFLSDLSVKAKETPFWPRKLYYLIRKVASVLLVSHIVLYVKPFSASKLPG